MIPSTFLVVAELLMVVVAVSAAGVVIELDTVEAPAVIAVIVYILSSTMIL